MMIVKIQNISITTKYILQAKTNGQECFLALYYIVNHAIPDAHLDHQG